MNLPIRRLAHSRGWESAIPKELPLAGECRKLFLNLNNLSGYPCILAFLSVAFRPLPAGLNSARGSASGDGPWRAPTSSFNICDARVLVWGATTGSVILRPVLQGEGPPHLLYSFRPPPTSEVLRPEGAGPQDDSGHLIVVYT